MPKTAIFELDGTLLDSVGLHVLAWQEAMAKFGHDVTFEQARSQIGKGGDKLVPSSCPRTNSGTTARKWRNGEASVSRRRTCRLCAPSPRSPICFDACAGKAGIATIGVLCGGFTETSLQEAGCADVYPGPTALFARFGESLLAK